MLILILSCLFFLPFFFLCALFSLLLPSFLHHSSICRLTWSRRGRCTSLLTYQDLPVKVRMQSSKPASLFVSFDFFSCRVIVAIEAKVPSSSCFCPWDPVVMLLHSKPTTSMRTYHGKLWVFTLCSVYDSFYAPQRLNHNCIRRNTDWK